MKMNYPKIAEHLGVKLRGDETFDELLKIEQQVKENKEGEEMYRYIAVEKMTPDVPRAWGEGKTPAIAKLQCEIAIREKVLGKMERGYGMSTEIDEIYIIKQEEKK